MRHFKTNGPSIYGSVGMTAGWKPEDPVSDSDALTDPQEIGRLFEAMREAGMPAPPGGLG